MFVKYLANAKLNLFLDITAVLENSYHALYTVMQSVTLCDRVCLESLPAGIELSCDNPDIPTDSGNIAHRAATLFFEKTGIQAGVRIVIEKSIPAGAGMGGGSADAAAVLRGLNELYRTPLGESALQRLGLLCGADVPFCMTGGTALCQNMGEVLSPLPAPGELWFVVAKSASAVSTREAYAAYDAAVWIRHPERERFLYHAAAGDTQAYLPLCTNVFEQVIDVPGRVQCKAIMRRFGAQAALMTGSGAAVYGIFDDPQKATDCANALRLTIPFVTVCQPAQRGILAGS